MFDEEDAPTPPAEPWQPTLGGDLAPPPAPRLPETEPVAAPGRPWLPGIVGGVVGALLVGALWLGVTLTGSDDAEPAAATATTEAVTTTAAPATTVPPTTVPTTTVAATTVPAVDGPSVAETGAQVIPTIVTVEVGNGSGDGFQGVGSGSGVIVDADRGYVVTNDHVVAAGPSSQVILADGRIYEATLVGTDPLTDLAVLQIPADELSAIAFGDSDELVVGDVAIAVGSPLGLAGGPSLTVGVISAFDRQVQTGPTDILYGMLQTDAPITNGSSGGALVDGQGRLIGITTAVGVSANGIEGIGFATPIEIVRRVVDELIEEGAIQHAFLGISGRTAFYGIDEGGSAPSGVEVLTVEPNSAAEDAGLVPGDVIVSVDGAAIDTMEDLIPLLRRERVGNQIRLSVDRAGEAITLTVTLGARTA